MRALALVLRFRLLSWRRFLRHNAFVLLVLGPLIGGSLLWIADRYLPLLRLLPDGALSTPSALPSAAALILALALTALALPASVGRLYPRRGAGALLDGLPVAAGTRFRALALAAWSDAGRTAAAVLLVLLLIARRGPGGLPPAAAVAAWGLTLAAVALALTAVALAATLMLIHLRLLRAAPLLLLAAALALAVAAGRSQPAAALPLLPWLAPAAQLDALLRQAAGLDAGHPGAGGAAALFATTAAAYLTALALYRRWQPGDRAAAHLPPRPRGSLLRRLLARVSRLFGRPVGAQVERDLILVTRRFSPAVYLAAGAVLAADLAAASALPELAATPYWRSRLALLAAAAGVLAAVALVPFLLRHQLPFAWLERASGLTPEDRWQAKLWLARLLALPASAGGAAALSVRAESAAELAVLALELALAAWVIATVVGLAAFEVAERPLLGLLFGAAVAAAFAALMILYRQLLPFWLIGYVVVAGSMAGRASRRLRFTEVAAR
ncbi:MAG: hypothetical protein D6696_19195 [Acidobacteria bacterium]|nr:MAG: hypothetical protein D6696_19195 [Acidobacteriota bacterium]